VEAPRTVRLEVNVGLGHERVSEIGTERPRANADGVAVREQLLVHAVSVGRVLEQRGPDARLEAAERELSELQGEEAGIGNGVAIERAVLPVDDALDRAVVGDEDVPR